MARDFYRNFFNPWEVPPTPALPPADAGLSQRIKKLADFASRNGPEFVTLFKEKQRHNPEYSFLLGADGHAYYKQEHVGWLVGTVYCRWCLHCMLTKQSVESMERQEQEQNVTSELKNSELVANEGSFRSMDVQDDVVKQFVEILDALDGSKDSVKAAQSWFMKHATLAEELAKLMSARILQSQDLTHEIRIFYVIDEILFKCHRHRKEEQLIYQVFESLIGPILNKIMSHGQDSEDVIRKAKKIISSWFDDGIYDWDTVAQFEEILKQGKTDLEPSIQSKDYEKEHKSLESRMTSSTLPPHMLPSSRCASSTDTVHGESNRPSLRSDSFQTRAAFDPPPSRQIGAKKSHHSFSFPAGMIPKLVVEKGKQSFSYSQITLDDLEKTGSSILVDPNEPYFKSRVEKFYAELEEYRPGMVREHLENRKRPEEVIDVDSEGPKRRRQRGSYPLPEEDKHTSMLPDGSFAGEASDSMYAGLGARTHAVKQTEEDRVFESYRKLRSDVYHNSIPKGTSRPRRSR